MTLQSPTATLIPLFSSSELTGCRYPGLLDRKNRLDMCPRWESNPGLPACKASTLSTRPGSLLAVYYVHSIVILYMYCQYYSRCIDRPSLFYTILRKVNNFYDFLYAPSLKDEAFCKGGLLLKERICSRRSKFFPLRVDAF